MMDREDGEMSDDETMTIEDIHEDKKNLITFNEPDSEYTVIYRANKGELVVEALEKVDASKLEERAKRFGLNLTGNKIITQLQIDELYSNFKIESRNERHYRLDTLHLSGIDGLSTKEIFEYLEDYKPVSLEWINDNSCNIVCQDHISAALALLVHSREIRHKDIKNMISQSSTYHWREGMPHEKKDFILMRFAVKSDKKYSSKVQKPQLKRRDEHENMDSITKNPWGELCQSWGVYDHQEVWNRKIPADYNNKPERLREPIQIKNSNLAKRLGKRSYKSEDSDSSNSDSEWTRKQKAPRMRMHADDEESKQNNKHVSPIKQLVEKESFAPLSIEVSNTNTTYAPKTITKLSDKFRTHDRKPTNVQKHSIHSRLGSKVNSPKNDDSWAGDDDSNESDHCVMSRVQRVTKKIGNSNVWSRLERQIDDSNDQNDLRKILKSKKNKDFNDLRTRIKSREGISLRVEIDNDYHDSD